MHSIWNSLITPVYSLSLIDGNKFINQLLSQFVKGENDGKVSFKSVDLGNIPVKKKSRIL